MKKQGGIIAVLLAVAVLFSCCCVFSLDKTNCYASDKIEQALLPVSFASTPEQALAIYGIKQSEIDWFTPHDESTASRLPGKSFTPLLVGEEGFKHINAEVLIGSQIQNVDLAGKNYADLKVCMWINFDQRISSADARLQIWA